MTFEQTVLLSALAGLTIYLGLPVGRLRNLSPRTQAILTTAAAGVILFLIWDILVQAVEPVESSLEAATSGDGPTTEFVTNAAALAVSLAVGLLSLVWLTGRMKARRTEGIAPRDVALGTAVGLGLHNLSEGLAIGQSGATGHARPGADGRVSQDTPASPRDNVRSSAPALRTPAGGGSSQQSAPRVTGPGSVVDSADDTVDDLPNPTEATPVQLPDAGEVVEGVTGQLPQVQQPQLKLKLLP